MFYLGDDDGTCKLVEYSSVSVKDAYRIAVGDKSLTESSDYSDE